MPRGQVVLLGDDRGLPIVGIGKVPVLLRNGETVHLIDVLHVPAMVNDLVFRVVLNNVAHASSKCYT